MNIVISKLKDTINKRYTIGSMINSFLFGCLLVFIYWFILLNINNHTNDKEYENKCSNCGYFDSINNSDLLKLFNYHNDINEHDVNY